MAAVDTMDRAREAVRHEEGRLLKPEEVAAWLGVSRAKAYAMLKAGEIPSVMVGGNRRVRFTALDTYLAQLEAESGSAA